MAMRVRVAIDRRQETHWVVEINGREAIGFWGATARVDAERQANALEQRLGHPNAAADNVNPAEGTAKRDVTEPRRA